MNKKILKEMFFREENRKIYIFIIIFLTTFAVLGFTNIYSYDDVWVLRIFKPPYGELPIKKFSILIFCSFAAVMICFEALVWTSLYFEKTKLEKEKKVIT